MVHNIHLYLGGQVDNTKWILCSQKIDVKCVYLRFLVYKESLSAITINLKVSFFLCIYQYPQSEEIDCKNGQI